MSAILSLLAGLLSIAPLVLDLPRAHDGRIVSRLALAALPWICVCGLPRAFGGREHAFWSPLLLAVPAFGLALGLDRAAGVPWSHELELAAGVLATLLAFSLARSLATRRGDRFVYGGWWLVAVPLPIVLAQALATAGPIPERLAWLRDRTPLGWIIDRVTLDVGATDLGALLDGRVPLTFDLAATAAPLTVAVLTVALARIAGSVARSERGEPA